MMVSTEYYSDNHLYAKLFALTSVIVDESSLVFKLNIVDDIILIHLINPIMYSVSITNISREWYYIVLLIVWCPVACY
jgi:hypothetical protein